MILVVLNMVLGGKMEIIRLYFNGKGKNMGKSEEIKKQEQPRGPTIKNREPTGQIRGESYEITVVIELYNRHKK